jgi:chemotaxis signal transduction protein
MPTHQAQLDTLSFYMNDVTRCEQSLHQLNLMWELIEASAKMNCPAEARLLLAAVGETRTNFGQLERALLTNLVHEKAAQVRTETATKARYTIDILVRNLFERTADVGFLASDAGLRRFVAGLDTDAGQVRQRLCAYRDKYTVYEEVMLLGEDGRVLMQTASGAAPVAAAEPLVAQSLAADGYVEAFRTTGLRPDGLPALMYAHRILHPDSGAPAGVLCLFFRFEHELDAIFSAYRDPERRFNMLLLDADDRVIASADPLWIPRGATVPVNLAGETQPQLFGGREYLVSTAASAGYQGYPGPAGWKTQVMVPLDLAFRHNDMQAFDRFEPAQLQGLLANAHTFSPALHQLTHAVSRTIGTIGRIVWNGKVGGAAGESSDKLNTVLDQITRTGAQSDALFSRATRDLYQTVLASSLRGAEFTSQLLVDLLDRNLYERANDCRWWALNAQLQHGLLRADDLAEAAAMRAVLEHINGLYTVYARLVVYDRQGRIVACTGAQDVLGLRIDARTLGAVCALHGELDHYAEPFGPSPLYDGRNGHVYHAAIRHPEQAGQIVGGIGAVFDSAAELPTMLRGGVGGDARMRACFVTPGAAVIAASDGDAYPDGTVMDDFGALLEEAAARGGSVSRIVTHRGRHCIAACTAASGYREFRAVAGREEPVFALLWVDFGPAGAATKAAVAAPFEQENFGGRDYATFLAGGALLAMAAADVQEAVPFARVQKAVGGAPERLGMLDVQRKDGGSHVVWVFDLARMLGGRPAAPDENSQVVLVRRGAHVAGLLVDSLHAVQAFDDDSVIVSPLDHDGLSLSPRLIKANRGDLVLQEICVDRLYARLHATP